MMHGQRNIMKTEIYPLLGYYEQNSDISLPVLTEQLWVPPSKVYKSRNKIYFKMQTNTVLRV